ncbi:MAG: DUF222 domain-containing protein [Mycobacterium sp.]
MFVELPDSALRAQLSDAEIDDAISVLTRAAATLAGHRLLFVGEKAGRNYDDDCDSLEDTDAAWNSAASEISMASGISHGRASGDMEIGLALAVRLPKIGDLLLAGDISERIARRIVHRTAYIADPDLLTLVETAVAESAVGWGALSQVKLDAAIDVWVNRHDPGALRRTRATVRDRGVHIVESKDGITEILLRLKGPDAALYLRRLAVMAHRVCKDDPRTHVQRLADAHGAIGAGFFHLSCECGIPDCPATNDDGRASHVVVFVYGEEAALQAEPDPFMDGDGPIPDEAATEQDSYSDGPAGEETSVYEGNLATEQDSAGRDSSSAEDMVVEPGAATDDFCNETRNEASDKKHSADKGEVAGAGSPDGKVSAESDSADTHPVVRPSPLRPPPGIIPGFGTVPAAEIAARIAAGAKKRHLKPPGIAPEHSYRPSVGLDEWVKARDLTCRWPNCDRPAQFCDYDHTTPWPAGATHASGGKMVCRQHHLGKTFWPGWSDVQSADGAITWTTPTGRSYTTRPGSSLFFPTVNTTSAPIATESQTPNSPDKIATMPKRRKRNRARERTRRINAERALNDAYVAERNKPPPF